MKMTASAILIYCALWFAGCAAAPQTFPINTMDKDRAVLVASCLSYGMPEEDAVAFLKQNGLTNMASGGESFSWSDCFSLSNRCSLCLVIWPKPPLSPDGAWVNGLVHGAIIYHWDGTNQIEPITLTNSAHTAYERTAATP